MLILLHLFHQFTLFTPYTEVQMKMDLFWDMFFHVIGGLGIFLLGMRYMSDGLQTVAGSKLRK
jgi:hypothetical protein